MHAWHASISAVRQPLAFSSPRELPSTHCGSSMRPPRSGRRARPPPPPERPYAKDPQLQAPPIGVPGTTYTIHPPETAAWAAEAGQHRAEPLVATGLQQDERGWLSVHYWLAEWQLEEGAWAAWGNRPDPPPDWVALSPKIEKVHVSSLIQEAHVVEAWEADLLDYEKNCWELDPYVRRSTHRRAPARCRPLRCAAV